MHSFPDADRLAWICTHMHLLQETSEERAMMSVYRALMNLSRPICGQPHIAAFHLGYRKGGCDVHEMALYCPQKEGQLLYRGESVFSFFPVLEHS